MEQRKKKAICELSGTYEINHLIEELQHWSDEAKKRNVTLTVEIGGLSKDQYVLTIVAHEIVKGRCKTCGGLGWTEDGRFVCPACLGGKEP